MIKKIITISVLTGIALANPLNDEYIESFNLEKKLIDKNYQIENKSWIGSPKLKYQASYSENNIDNNTKDFYELSYNQDVFRSGGIAHAINYSKINKELKLINLDYNEQQIIYNVFKNNIDIEINQKNIDKNNILLNNANIELKILEDRFFVGEDTIINLNTKLLEINNLKNAKINLTNNIEMLKTENNKYTNNNFTSIDIKKILKLDNEISYDDYINKHFSNQITNKEIELKSKYYDLEKSTFMPKVSINSSVSKHNGNENIDRDAYLGLSVSIPIDFSMNKKLEHSKINVLNSKNKKEIMDIKISQEYKLIINNINNIKNKNILSNKNIDIYNNLLKTIQEQYTQGYKTKNDVSIMKNNLLIEKLNKEINELSIIKEKISLRSSIK